MNLVRPFLEALYWARQAFNWSSTHRAHSYGACSLPLWSFACKRSTTCLQKKITALPWTNTFWWWSVLPSWHTLLVIGFSAISTKTSFLWSAKPSTMQPHWSDTQKKDHSNCSWSFFFGLMWAIGELHTCRSQTHIGNLEETALHGLSNARCRNLLQANKPWSCSPLFQLPDHS